MTADVVSSGTVNAKRGNTVLLWIGRVLSGLVACLFLMSAAMKLARPEGMGEQMSHLGLPESMILPLGILELTCVVLYLIPMTAILGAVLLTGYLGGAICTHWRVGDNFLIPVVLGLVVWGGLYLRERRLQAVLPLRRRD